MEKFTPGPWVFDGPPNNQIVWSDANNRICFLAHSDGMDDQRDIANATLIAAAPELVEALKVAKAHIVLLRGDERDWLDSDETDRAVLDAIDAALSKAGVSP